MFFKNTDGKIINGMLYASEKSTVNYNRLSPAIVGLKSCSDTSTTNNSSYFSQQAWIQTMNDNGFIILLLDNTQFDCTESYELNSNKINDIIAAKKYLDSMPNVDDSEIGLMGWSRGALSVLQFLSKSGLFTDEPLADFYNTVAFSPDCTQVTSKGYQIKTSLIIVMSDSDKPQSILACEKISQEKSNKYPGIKILVYHNPKSNNPAISLSYPLYSKENIIKEILIYLKEPWKL